jgi:hypothetical protein
VTTVLRSAGLALLAGLLAFGAGNQTRAGSIVFDLQVSPDPVLPGGTVTASVYLKETGDTVLADIGIFAAKFKVTFFNATLTGSPMVNGGFDQSVVTPSSADVVFDVAAVLVDMVKSDPATPDTLFLGSIQLTAGDSGWVSVGVQAADPGLDNVLDGNGNVLDSGLGTPAVRIGIVPEPSSVVMLSLGALAGVGLVRHRRRRAA